MTDDNIGKTNFDFLRDCGCSGSSAPDDVVPCSDQAEDVNFNNIGTNYAATNVRSALIEVDNKRVTNGSDILARVQKAGDSMSGDLVFENPITQEVGRIIPQVTGIGLQATNIISMDTPNVAVSGWSTLIGYTLTVGQDGLIVPVLTTVPETSWNDVNNSGVALANQAFTDLGVLITTTEIVDSWQYKAVITGTASVPLNLTFQLKADGNPIASTQAAAVVAGSAGTSVQFSEVSIYASGTVFTIEAQIDEASGDYTVDFIDFTFNKLSADAGTTWGSITGTLADQVDLNSALGNKSNIGHNHTTLSALTTLNFVAQVTDPVHAAGNLFYSDKDGLLIFQTDKPGVQFTIPNEIPRKVINKTGVTITNGSVCRHDGVDIATGLPKIALAIADNFNNATILGIATHEILNDEDGWITRFGKVNDLDTSGDTAGVPMYLSDTIAGTWSETAPAIVSQVGGVSVVDASNGVLEVEINSNIQLPTLVSVMQGQNFPVYAVTAVSQNIDDYITASDFGTVSDPLLGTIDIPVSGLWAGSFTAGLSFASTTSTRTIYIEIYESIGMNVIFTYPVNVPRDATEQGISMNSEFSALAGQVYAMRIRASVAISVTISDTSMSIKSIRLN